METAAPGSAFGTGWLFGGEYVPGSERAGYDDAAFTPVALPHTVTPLSWGGWDPASWQKIWIYRRHFAGRELLGHRVFADFGGVMVNAAAVLDRGRGSHRGGYLPWSIELTGHIVPGNNVLAIIVDARCLPVPPIAPGQGPESIDFLQPGGIYRDAALRLVPPVYVADVFARPADVLTSRRRVDVQCTMTRPGRWPRPTSRSSSLTDPGGWRFPLSKPGSGGRTVISGRLTGLGPVRLWSPAQPVLYTVRVTVSAPPGARHTLSRRIGFREAVFRTDRYSLNGQPCKIFGLNRHQMFPYLGMAAPARLQRRDAEIIRNELNCNMVRCSHYPQSPHFLDACNELGLMVWQEPPGWGLRGGDAWQDLVLGCVHDMVVRDHSRPSVIVWATRLNETPPAPAWTRGPASSPTTSTAPGRPRCDDRPFHGRLGQGPVRF